MNERLQFGHLGRNQPQINGKAGMLEAGLVSGGLVENSEGMNTRKQIFKSQQNCASNYQRDQFQNQ